VIIWDINQEAIAATVEELSEFGHVHGFKADISDPASIDTAFEATRIGCGNEDILINNASIITNNKTFVEQTDEDIYRTFDINTKGAMYITRRFLH